MSPNVSDLVSTPMTATDAAGTDQLSQAMTVLPIMVVPTASGVQSVQVPINASANQVLEKVCNQCELGQASFYALLCRGADELVQPNQTVSQLQNVGDLVLVERTSLRDAFFATPHTGSQPVVEQPKYKNAMDIISNYKVCCINWPGNLMGIGIFC